MKLSKKLFGAMLISLQGLGWAGIGEVVNPEEIQWTAASNAAIPSITGTVPVLLSQSQPEWELGNGRRSSSKVQCILVPHTGQYYIGSAQYTCFIWDDQILGIFATERTLEFAVSTNTMGRGSIRADAADPKFRKIRNQVMKGWRFLDGSPGLRYVDCPVDYLIGYGELTFENTSGRPISIKTWQGVMEIQSVRGDGTNLVVSVKSLNRLETEIHLDRHLNVVAAFRDGAPLHLSPTNNFLFNQRKKSAK